MLTTKYRDALLPTILSRCQPVQLSSLNISQIEEALIRYDDFAPEDAQYLARISGGNYVMARFLDIQTLKQMRKEIVSFLRDAYTQEADSLTKMVKNWQSQYNIERQMTLLNVLETLLRDLLVYRNTGEKSLIINLDQADTIVDFCNSLQEARIEVMIEQVNKFRPLLRQYVQPKLIFTVLAMRFSYLMRGQEIPIPSNKSWEHLPAYSE